MDIDLSKLSPDEVDELLRQAKQIKAARNASMKKVFPNNTYTRYCSESGKQINRLLKYYADMVRRNASADMLAGFQEIMNRVSVANIEKNAMEFPPVVRKGRPKKTSA